MIPGVRFVPRAALSSDFEINHNGVVVRCRAGHLEHIGGVRHEHEPQAGAFAAYRVIEVPLEPHGAVVPDEHRGGWWLVPDGCIDGFRDWLEADAAARAAKEG